jgi:hypothetical protein
MHKVGRKYYNDAGEQVCPECGAVIEKPHGNQIYCQTRMYTTPGITERAGRSYCKHNAASRRRRNTEHGRKKDKEYRIKSNKRRNKIYWERKNSGICTRCGKQEASMGYTTCYVCAEENYLKYHGGW